MATNFVTTGLADFTAANPQKALQLVILEGTGTKDHFGFETGVKYQMYHALLLLLIGFFLKFETGIEKTTAWFIILGTFLFSVSIYFLSFQDILKTNLKFLGPITPIGGLFMILGWALLIYVFAKTKF